ncbi:MAG: two-component sensor histidine kinase [Spirosomataceae bacterium]|jgi:two-component sensor histidine kinase
MKNKQFTTQQKRSFCLFLLLICPLFLPFLLTAQTPLKYTKQAAIFEKKAMDFSNVEKFDSVEVYLLKAKAIHEKNDSQKQLADVLHRLSLNCYKLGKFDESLAYDFKALAIREEINDKDGVANSYVNISTDFCFVGKFQTGIEYGIKAVELCQEVNNQKGLGLAYHGLASNYVELGKYTEALNSINQAVAIKQKISPGAYTVLSSLNTQGNVYKLMGRHNEALKSYQKVIEMGEEINAQRGTATGLANTGHTHLLMGQKDKALPYLLRAIEVGKSINFLANLPEQYMHVSDIYESRGDFENALIYHKKLKEQEGAIFTAEKNRTTTELQTQYETGKKDALLTIKDEQISQQRQIQYLFIGITVILAAFLFALYRSYLSRNKRLRITAELNEKLKIKNAENELLLKEIHHRVKNNLEVVSSLLELQSAQIDDPDIQAAMQASQNRVQSMGILHQKLYQSEHLAFIEMKNYFLNLTENILDSYDATERVEVEFPMENLELDVDTAVPIGLIVNELITNALKYAFPTGMLGKIKLSLQEVEENLLQLSISDNGVGKIVNASPTGTGFGTQLVELLTRQLDGKLTQSVENGTTVTIQFARK